MARCTQVGDGPRGRRDHEPSSARRYALFLVVMAFMLSLLGQDCTISCNPPPPPSCAGCKGDQVVVLDRSCATPRKAGESCEYDFPCAADGMCETGYVCVAPGPVVTNAGTCQPDTIAQPCDSSTPCGSLEYCRQSDLCGGTQSCALPLQAGSPCLPGDPCSPCALGLTCYAPPGSGGLAGFGLPYPGTCVLAQLNATNITCGSSTVQTCTSNTDCNNCAGATCLAVQQDFEIAFGLSTTAADNVAAGGQCRTCAQGLRSACSQQTPCCTPGQECVFTDMGNGTCCESVGAPCPDGISDCCPGITMCRATSLGAAFTCELCAGEGQYAASKFECCPGTTLVNGICQCDAPGSKCSTRGDCCADDVCVPSPLKGAGKFCEACPQYLNPCTTPGDCCGGNWGLTCATSGTQKGFCCVQDGAFCTASTQCCGASTCMNGECVPPPCQGIFGLCSRKADCCPGSDCQGGNCCGLSGVECVYTGGGPTTHSGCCSGTCLAPPSSASQGVCK